ncbi:MAG TPA: hypothetical protein VGY99_01740 [Candidatus Binataceae bacterium]|jgi:hypothetical protein|nr:hypothetical protein [Candidatus Binataceae bacterium]
MPPAIKSLLALSSRIDYCEFFHGLLATIIAILPQVLVDFPEVIERFRQLLLGMAYKDTDVWPLLDFEGLKVWKEGREEEGHPP